MRKVSIIIPAYNEEKYIATCIESCFHQEGEGFDVEVIVCDGGSSDQTRAIISSLQEKYQSLVVLDNAARYTSFALNLGIKYSQADVKIILGAHAEVYPDFVKNNLKSLDDHPDAGCVGGIIENIYLDNESSQIGKAMSSPFGVGNAHFRTGKFSGYVDTVAFGAYRKEVFEKIGYFDEELIRNQDDEFNFRLTKSGFKIYLDASIRSKYFVRASFKKLFRQYYQYGFWKIYANKKNRAITTVRQMIPFFFVLFLFFFPVLTVISPYFLAAYVAILLLYINLAAFVTILSRGGIGMAWAFFILHLSYGTGYLHGIFYFLIFNKSAPAQQSVTR
jgi:glycosyltransferase involved in cell wall biosynthesis